MGVALQLERILRSQGFGSRPVCRDLVLSGRVAINGKPCDDPLVDLEPKGLAFSVDDVAWVYREFCYVMLNKPIQYECSHKPDFYPSIYSLLPRPLITRGIQAVGRLDADTTGLLLLSDDGQFIHTFTSPKKNVAKIYEITTRHPIISGQVETLLAGVTLHDDPKAVRATACDIIDEKTLKMTVTEGKFHLVRRMVAAAGNRVEALHRTEIGGLTLPGELPGGQWRWLDERELRQLGWEI